MDPISQGALGAVCAQVGAKKQKLVYAGVLGLIAGLAPDLDIFLRSSDDPLLFLQFHRQFTHSLIFAPVGAFFITILSWRMVKKYLSFLEAYKSCLLGFLSHGLLDACTTYGTQNLWPFSNVRVAWNTISIIDPLITVPLICFIILGCIKRRKIFVYFGLVWSLAYLFLGAFQNFRATAISQVIASSRGHVPKNLTVKPSFGNLVLWKSIYEFEGFYYTDAIRIIVDKKICLGERTEKFIPGKHTPKLIPGSQLAKDIERFRKFSNGYLSFKEESSLILDARYSMIPNEFSPLWGITVNLDSNQNKHADWWENNSVTVEKKTKFLALLKGENCHSFEQIEW